MRAVFPFSAIVGQDDMKRALIVAAVDRSVGGVLVFGDRGTGKSTAVRALAHLLPPMRVVAGCRYNCDPDASRAGCTEDCPAAALGAKIKVAKAPVPVVDLPLGATEDRVVEREGLSVRPPAKFVLVGSGNPEEGELRPQLLDRFGLSVDVRTPADLPNRIAVVRRRDAFERGPERFVKEWAGEEAKLQRKIATARKRLPEVTVPDAGLERPRGSAWRSGRTACAARSP